MMIYSLLFFFICTPEQILHNCLLLLWFFKRYYFWFLLIICNVSFAVTMHLRISFFRYRNVYVCSISISPIRNLHVGLFPFITTMRWIFLRLMFIPFSSFYFTTFYGSYSFLSVPILNTKENLSPAENITVYNKQCRFTTEYK